MVLHEKQSVFNDGRGLRLYYVKRPRVPDSKFIHTQKLVSFVCSHFKLVIRSVVINENTELDQNGFSG